MGASLMSSAKKAITVLVAGTLSLALLSACTRQEVSLDGPSYASVSDLVQDPAVVVVAGVFGERPERVSESDLGATFEVEDEQGLDLDLWPFTVTEVLVGDEHVADTIRVTQIVLPESATHAEQAQDEDMHGEVAYTAEPGRTSVLFLRPYPNESAYAVLGLGVGSLDVAPDGSITAPPRGIQGSRRRRPPSWDRQRARRCGPGGSKVGLGPDETASTSGPCGSKTHAVITMDEAVDLLESHDALACDGLTAGRGAARPR
ncbi:hypothetical protein [Salana multivorans]